MVKKIFFNCRRNRKRQENKLKKNKTDDTIKTKWNVINKKDEENIERRSGERMKEWKRYEKGNNFVEIDDVKEKNRRNGVFN